MAQLVAGRLTPMVNPGDAEPWTETGWCDCRVRVSTKGDPIAFCPLHSAAKDLLAACEAALEDRLGWGVIMEAAVRKAKGE